MTLIERIDYVLIFILIMQIPILVINTYFGNSELLAVFIVSIAVICAIGSAWISVWRSWS